MRIPGFAFFVVAVLIGQIAVPAQPVITKQPVDQSVSLGANVTLQVSGTSKAPPILYQWRVNGTSIDGQTRNILSLSAVEQSTAGLYDVILTDGMASTTSKAARLEVDATFTKVTSGNIVTDVGYGIGCAWGDYDNDGFIDLIVTCASETAPTAQKNVLFRN